MRGRKRIYKVNENFFTPPLTPESAYVMGFFLSDGNYKVSMVQKKWPAYSIAFGLHERDIEILHKIRRAMESDHPITVRQMRGFKIYPHACLMIHSKRIALDLLETWNIPRDKSGTAGLPDLPCSLQNHLVRGYFDGDGHIGLYNHKDGWRNRVIGFSGGPIINDIRDVIDAHTGRAKKARYRQREGGSGWEILYGSQDREVLVWLYKGATIYLDRKYQLALRFLQETDPDA